MTMSDYYGYGYDPEAVAAYEEAERQKEFESGYEAARQDALEDLDPIYEAVEELDIQRAQEYLDEATGLGYELALQDGHDEALTEYLDQQEAEYLQGRCEVEQALGRSLTQQEENRLILALSDDEVSSTDVWMAAKDIGLNPLAQPGARGATVRAEYLNARERAEDADPSTDDEMFRASQARLAQSEELPSWAQKR